jgi:branched-chain amino acid transport system ATP-binding protein
VLMIEHHFELLEGVARRMTVMNFGRKIAEGSPANERCDPEVIRCYLGTGRQNVTEVAPC